MAQVMKIGMDSESPDQLWEAAGRTEACDDLESRCWQRLCPALSCQEGAWTRTARTADVFQEKIGS